jgi:hypothetical protein
MQGWHLAGQRVGGIVRAAIGIKPRHPEIGRYRRDEGAAGSGSVWVKPETLNPIRSPFKHKTQIKIWTSWVKNTWMRGSTCLSLNPKPKNMKRNSKPSSKFPSQKKRKTLNLAFDQINNIVVVDHRNKIHWPPSIHHNIANHVFKGPRL